MRSSLRLLLHKPPHSHPKLHLHTHRNIPNPTSISHSNHTITKLSREGRLSDARKLFDQMPQKDVVSWTAIVSAYVRRGLLVEARSLLHYPDALSNVVTWTSLLSGYVRASRISEAESFFSQMPHKNVVSWNTLLSGYADNGLLNKALELFDEMPERNVVSWNTIVSALARVGRVDEALRFFERMRERDVVSWTAMVAGLSQNGRVDEARALFDEMPVRNVVSWNAMVSGYAQNSQLEEALSLFESMPVRDIPSWNTMISGFVRNGDLGRARALFEEMEERNVVTWTALITGYAQDGQGEEALKVFSLMQNDGIRPNQGTFVSVLSAVSDLAGHGEGRQIHQIICKTIFQFSPFVESALVSMYAKCGEIATAREMFDKAENKDLVTWNSMVASYAHHGCGVEAIQLFEDMKRKGVKPDGSTYVGVLSGCSHSGLVDVGLKLFGALLNDGSVKVREDHFACLVDLCGRAGRLEDVARFIDMHEASRTSACVWGALLAGCNVHGNVEIGNLAAKKLLKAEPGNSGTYMLLSNIYASAGRWKDAWRVRSKMKDNGLKKQPGCSWIEVGNMVHVFTARDKSHKQREMIYCVLKNLHYDMKVTGYVSDSEISLPVSLLMS